jgi:hypothetical protein
MASDETAQEAYDRGTVAGKIDARLAGHDKHFESINGSLEKVAAELNGLKLAVQRLGDQAVSRDATVVTTAAALKDAEDARRSKTESAWTPVAKAIAIGSVALAAIGTVLAVLLR